MSMCPGTVLINFAMLSETVSDGVKCDIMKICRYIAFIWVFRTGGTVRPENCSTELRGRPLSSG